MFPSGKLAAALSFREAYSHAAKMNTKHPNDRTGLAGANCTLYIPPFDANWNLYADHAYTTRYGSLKSPKITDPHAEAFYQRLLQQNRSIYEEFLQLNVDKHQSASAFFGFLRKVIQPLAFEGDSMKDWRHGTLAPKRNEEVTRAQRNFYFSHNTKHHYNVWRNISQQTKDALFKIDRDVDPRRRAALDGIGNTPKSLVFFLLKEYCEVLEKSQFIDKLKEIESFAKIQQLFYEQCVRDISIKSGDRAPMQFIVERITDTMEAHYYYLIHLRENFPEKMPEYCRFEADKVFEELTTEEKKKLACSHTIFRNFYLQALIRAIPVRAAKCFDTAVKLYHEKKVEE